ncbi:MAG TPA: DUF4339 domain-containing protein [Acidobacteriaceae bacterium]|jgi:hypothetical protein
MTYRIEREGQTFGPYSLMQLQRHLASGHVAETDRAQGEGMEEWLPVSELFPAPPPHHAAEAATVPARLYPDPPDLPWWVALLLGVVTLGAFFVAWDIREAAWLRRVERRNLALVLYILAALLFLLDLPATIGSVMHAAFDGPPVEAPFALALSLAGLLARLIARFVLRNDLCRHFNRDEGIGLKLNWVFTLLFGGLYFQFHFNRINALKRALRVSVP